MSFVNIPAQNGKLAQTVYVPKNGGYVNIPGAGYVHVPKGGGYVNVPGAGQVHFPKK